MIKVEFLYLFLEVFLFTFKSLIFLEFIFMSEVR